MLNIIMLNVMLNIVMMNIVMMNAVMLNVVILIVVALHRQSLLHKLLEMKNVFESGLYAFQSKNT